MHEPEHELARLVQRGGLGYLPDVVLATLTALRIAAEHLDIDIDELVPHEVVVNPAVERRFWIRVGNRHATAGVWIVAEPDDVRVAEHDETVAMLKQPWSRRSYAQGGWRSK